MSKGILFLSVLVVCQVANLSPGLYVGNVLCGHKTSDEVNIQQLRKQLKNSNKNIVSALEYLSRSDVDVAPLLTEDILELVDSSSSTVRNQVAIVISKLNGNTSKLMGVYSKLLDDTETRVVHSALISIRKSSGSFEPKERAKLSEQVVGVMQRDDPTLNISAAKALRRIAPADNRAVLRLRQLLGHPRFGIQCQAVGTLAEEGKGIIGVITEMCNESASSQFRINVISVLSLIWDSDPTSRLQIQPLLIKYSNDTEPDVRRHATFTLNLLSVQH